MPPYILIDKEDEFKDKKKAEYNRTPIMRVLDISNNSLKSPKKDKEGKYFGLDIISLEILC